MPVATIEAVRLAAISIIMPKRAYMMRLMPQSMVELISQDIFAIAVMYALTWVCKIANGEPHVLNCATNSAFKLTNNCVICVPVTQVINPV